jgi:sec-independent protein translocase protein TatA
MFDSNSITDVLFLAWTPGPWELAIIAGIFLMLFGGQKLPGLMRNLGRSVNEFKQGIKDKPSDTAIEDGTDN